MQAGLPIQPHTVSIDPRKWLLSALIIKLKQEALSLIMKRKTDLKPKGRFEISAFTGFKKLSNFLKDFLNHNC
jgi:hypothetical protein